MIFQNSDEKLSAKTFIKPCTNKKFILGSCLIHHEEDLTVDLINSENFFL